MPNPKLPDFPSLESLKKLSKSRLKELRLKDPQAKLTTVQLEIAREQGFSSWRALKAQLDDRSSKKITSAVMRYLPVADLNRSLAFYRTILGFEIRRREDGVEAALGPALIRFGKEGYSPTDWNTPKAPGSAILFFESSNMEALHAAIRERGGKPSAIEKVNWIKMSMFEIRDPDGNVLWFGQSYHKNEEAPSRRNVKSQGLSQALPELPFDNVTAAVAWYREVLGFRINYQQHDLGVMDRDAISLLLIARTDQHKGIGSCEIYISDADALYEELQSRGAQIAAPPVSQPWGLRTFQVIDLEGNRITFAQTFE